MPRPPKGAGKTRDQLLLVAQALGYNKAAFSRATGMSYWKSRQLVDQLKERKSLDVVLGKRNPERKAAELQRTLENSGYTFRRERFREKGIDRLLAVPPEPTKGKDFAKKIQSKKFKKQGVTKTTYEYAPGKRIKLSPTDTIQVRAKGKGKSAGKSIKTLHSELGDWSSAWSSWVSLAKTTNFTARDFEIVVIR